MRRKGNGLLVTRLWWKNGGASDLVLGCWLHRFWCSLLIPRLLWWSSSSLCFSLRRSSQWSRFSLRGWSWRWGSSRRNPALADTSDRNQRTQSTHWTAMSFCKALVCWISLQRWACILPWSSCTRAQAQHCFLNQAKVKRNKHISMIEWRNQWIPEPQTKTKVQTKAGSQMDDDLVIVCVLSVCLASF